uniref:Uncharacterized protein n=1 Tax=Amorphochlora amoebiformis TaxID=1561963 RepID=A0A0H5BQY0_9EUKA|nr:hypothetical protein [Amorphochlora amoebiformis]
MMHNGEIVNFYLIKLSYFYKLINLFINFNASSSKKNILILKTILIFNYFITDYDICVSLKGFFFRINLLNNLRINFLIPFYLSKSFKTLLYWIKKSMIYLNYYRCSYGRKKNKNRNKAILCNNHFTYLFFIEDNVPILPTLLLFRKLKVKVMYNKTNSKSLLFSERITHFISESHLLYNFCTRTNLKLEQFIDIFNNCTN